MSLANLQNIIDYNILEHDVAVKAEKYLNHAEQTMRGWIGDEKYEDMVASGSADAYKTFESNREYADTEFSNTVEAESLLAFAYALPRLNMRITPKGGLVKATGFSESRNSLMGKRELDSYVREIMSQAKLLVREIMVDGVMSSDDRQAETFVL